MLKRTLCFESDGSLSVRNRQLVFEAKVSNENRPISVPVEDIGVVIVESRHIMVSTYALGALSEAGAIVIVCDGAHMPSGSMLPLAGHTLTQKTTEAQLEATKALKEKLWKQTVVAKIRNQAACLRRNGIAGADDVAQFARYVSAGDPENREGQAAARYFKAWNLVRQTVRSGVANPLNSALNYGYSLIRAAMARALSGSGLLCVSGIHHHGQYDPFVLADDIMEPYRPFVDDLVLANRNRLAALPIDSGLDRTIKIELLKSLARDVSMGGVTSPMLVAMSRTSASLAACFERREQKIQYPEFPE